MLPPAARGYLIGALGNTPLTLSALLASLAPDSARWNTRPDPDRFNLREILAHLADWEEVWQERFERIAQEDEPRLSRPDLDRRAEEKGYSQADPLECLARFAAARQALLEQLQTLPERTWERTGYLDRIGELPMNAYLALALSHDASHIRQIAEWLQPRPLRGIIFDFDGTLADTLPLCFAAFRAAFARYLPARSFTDEEIAAYFGPDEEGVIRQALTEEAHWTPALEAYLEAYQAAHSRYCTEPFPGIAPLLEVLHQRGVSTAVVTGKGAVSAAISLERLGLARYFELVEAGSAERAVKPEAIRKVLTAWGLPPDSVAYVGDSPGDIRAARSVGAVALGAAWAQGTDREALAAVNPDALFPSIQEFALWLERYS